MFLQQKMPKIETARWKKCSYSDTISIKLHINNTHSNGVVIFDIIRLKIPVCFIGPAGIQCNLSVIVNLARANWLFAWSAPMQRSSIFTLLNDIYLCYLHTLRTNINRKRKKIKSKTPRFLLQCRLILDRKCKQRKCLVRKCEME